MFFLVYKITNLVNSKIYIDCHKTEDKDDDYMGSGKLIVLAIKKYGIEKFQKEILFEADSSQSMFSKERELVELGSHSYNLKNGGDGGWDYINRNNLCPRKGHPPGFRKGRKQGPHTELHRQRISLAHLGKPKLWSRLPKSSLHKQHISEARKQSLKVKLVASTKIACLYCSTTADIGNLNRWHNEKCHLKPSIQV